MSENDGRVREEKPETSRPNRRGILKRAGAVTLGIPAAAGLAGGDASGATESGESGDAPSLAWELTYGGGPDVGAAAAERTASGDYVVAGTGTGAELARVTADGDHPWSVDGYGGFTDVALAPDGGYVLAAADEGTVLKLDRDCGREWATTVEVPPCYPDSSYVPRALVRTADDGYAVAGALRVGAAGPATGDSFRWAGKVNASGTVEWNRVFERPSSGDDAGGEANSVTRDEFVSLARTGEGRLVAGGVEGTDTADGEQYGNPSLVRVDPADGTSDPISAAFPDRNQYRKGLVNLLTPTVDGGVAYHAVFYPDDLFTFGVVTGDRAASSTLAWDAEVTSLVQSASGEFVLAGRTWGRTQSEGRETALVGVAGPESVGRGPLSPRWTKTLGAGSTPDSFPTEWVRDLVANDNGVTAVGRKRADRTERFRAWAVRLKD